MTVAKKNLDAAPAGKTTHSFFYDISKEGRATFKKSVTQQEPGSMKEMHRSLQAGQFCYRHEGRYVMMSRRDGEKLGLKPVPLREGWKTFQELNGKDVALGARPDRSLAGLQNGGRTKSPASPPTRTPSAAPSVSPRPKPAPAASPSQPRAAAVPVHGDPKPSDAPAVAYRDKDRQVLTAKDGRKVVVESEIVLYGEKPAGKERKTDSRTPPRAAEEKPAFSIPWIHLSAAWREGQERTVRLSDEEPAAGPAAEERVARAESEVAPFPGSAGYKA
ncbi:hypothetical protein F9K50_10130 [bacterium]|nr:MAG: hypothetical protein F9K50_10130 [bacterium]